MIFYTCPEGIPLEDDGVRSVNIQFRDDIIGIYDDLLKGSWTLPGRDTWRHKLVKLTGSVDHRMETIKNTIEL